MVAPAATRSNTTRRFEMTQLLEKETTTLATPEPAKKRITNKVVTGVLIGMLAGWGAFEAVAANRSVRVQDVQAARYESFAEHQKGIWQAQVQAIQTGRYQALAEIQKAQWETRLAEIQEARSQALAESQKGQFGARVVEVQEVRSQAMVDLHRGEWSLPSES